MSVRIVAQLTLAPGHRDAGEALARRLCDCAAALEELDRAHAGVNGPGSQGGGDLTLDLLFASESACESFLARSGPVPGLGLAAGLGKAVADLEGQVAATDAVVVEPLSAHVGRPGLVGVKRTLLLRVHEGAPADRLADFERDMLAMPAYVPAIRNWSFGRVRTQPPRPGPSRWTHVWEQEFESVDGLLQDYMASPYHWGHLDGWFDLEHPECVVDAWLAHVYCPATEGVLSWVSPAGA